MSVFDWTAPMRNVISVELKRDCEAVQIPEDSGFGIKISGARGSRPAKCLTTRTGLLDCTRFGWGRSSVGRAPQWHCGGQGFESPRLHHSEDCSEKEAQTWPRRL